MLVRVITGIVGVAAMIPIMWFSDTYLFPIILAAFCVIGLHEAFSCTKMKGKLFVTLPSYALGAVMPLVCKYFESFDKLSSAFCAVIFLYLIYLIFCAVIFHDKCEINILSMCFVLSIYIIGGFSSLQLLRNLSDGILAVFAVILAAWITDIFAYFTGKFLGKHKLCETISPKKTVEGSIGGTLFCVAIFAGYSFVSFGKWMPWWSYILVAVIGLVLSIVAQIGDLSMSVIKRKYNVKDFGNIFPGHGGILDRFDSILAVAPVLLTIILVTNSILR